MNLSQSFGQEQSLELEQRLSLSQRQMLSFGDFTTTSYGKCTKCGHELTEKEILAGFSDDPYDFRTTCPKCEEKFLSNLMIKRDDDKDVNSGKEKFEQVTFMCPNQTLNQMKTVKDARNGRIGITYLADHDRQLFYNIIRHWGTYENGLEALKKYAPNRQKKSSTAR